MSDGGHVRPVSGSDPGRPEGPSPDGQDSPDHPQLFTAARFERYEAPTLPVDIIRELNAIQPDLGTELARMTLSEAEHRRELERDDLARTHRANTRAQWMAFAFTMTGLVVAGVAIVNGQEVAGALVGLGSLGAVLTATARRRR